MCQQEKRGLEKMDNKNKIHAKTFARLLNISDKSFYVWKRKTHIDLIKILEQYFSEDEMEEFLSSGKIQKFEIINSVNFDELTTYINHLMSSKINEHNQLVNNEIQKKQQEINKLKSLSKREK